MQVTVIVKGWVGCVRDDKGKEKKMVEKLFYMQTLNMLLYLTEFTHW